MPISETKLQILQYCPPNEVETSSTNKEHWNGLDLKDIVSTCWSLQNNQTLNRIFVVVERRILALSYIVENEIQTLPGATQWEEVGFLIRNTQC